MKKNSRGAVVLMTGAAIACVLVASLLLAQSAWATPDDWQADMFVVSIDGSPGAGSTRVYRVVIENDGDDTANDVRLTFSPGCTPTMNGNPSFVSSTQAGVSPSCASTVYWSTCDAATCTFSHLNPQETATFDFVVNTGSTIDVAAQVFSATPDGTVAGASDMENNYLQVTD